MNLFFDFFLPLAIVITSGAFFISIAIDANVPLIQTLFIIGSIIYYSIKLSKFKEGTNDD